MTRNSKPSIPRRRPGYSKVKVVDLVADLARRGLPTTGKKPDLIARLEEDDRNQAEARFSTALESPQDAAHAFGLSRIPTETFTAYHTAYTGKPVTANGKFHHFESITDESHRQRGHWCFESVQDDHRALARHMLTPEAILVEQDRSGDTSFDEIILRWMPGSDETEMKAGLVGPASSHLRTLYTLKKITGQPLSFRGQTPVYPISQDPRVKQYWATYSSPHSKVSTDAAAVDSSNTMNSTISRGTQSGPSNTSGSFHDTNLAPKPSSLSHGTPNTPKALSPLKPPNDFGFSEPHQPIASPSTPVAHGPSTSTVRVKNSKTLDKAATHNKHGEFTPAGTEHHGVDSAPQVLQMELLGGPEVFPATKGPVTPDFLNDGPIPSSHYTALSTRDASLPVSPEHALLQQSVSPPQHPAPPPRSYEEAPQCDLEEWGGMEQIEKDLAALIASDAVLEDTEHVDVRAGDTLRTASLTSFVDTSESKKGNTDPNEAKSSQLSVSSSNAPNSPSSVADDERIVIDCEGDIGVVQPMSPPAIEPDIHPRSSAGYLDIPCMDCGLMEIEGHAFDCHIGNIIFSDKLTFLDYRRIADAVEYFDPGPWTTHFDPYPTPPPEDPEAQIIGMADVIRNEESYKNDEELHSLPDSMMVLLWALRSLPGVKVLRE